MSSMSEIRKESLKKLKSDRDIQEFIKEMLESIMRIDPDKKINKDALFSKDSKTVGSNLTRLF